VKQTRGFRDGGTERTVCVTTAHDSLGWGVTVGSQVTLPRSRLCTQREREREQGARYDDVEASERSRVVQITLWKTLGEEGSRFKARRGGGRRQTNRGL
jgi:hypothetical protein